MPFSHVPIGVKMVTHEWNYITWGHGQAWHSGSTRLRITVQAVSHNVLDKAKVVHGRLALVSSLQDLINQGTALFGARERVFATDDLMGNVVQICPNCVEDALCKPFKTVWLPCCVHCFGGGCCVQRVGSVESYYTAIHNEFVQSGDVWIDRFGFDKYLDVGVNVDELSYEGLFDCLPVDVELCVWLENMVDSVFDNVVACDETVYGSPADWTDVSCYPTVGHASDAECRSDLFELRVATKAIRQKEVKRNFVPVVDGAGDVSVKYVDLFAH